MWSDKSKLVPTAFWLGFLALGFVTNFGSPNKHRVIDRAAAWSTGTAVASRAIPQTESQSASMEGKAMEETP